MKKRRNKLEQENFRCMLFLLHHTNEWNSLENALVNSSIEFLLSTYYVPDIVRGTGAKLNFLDNELRIHLTLNR